MLATLSFLSYLELFLWWPRLKQEANNESSREYTAKVPSLDQCTCRQVTDHLNSPPDRIEEPKITPINYIVPKPSNA
jgi:hypothetical protein